MQEESRDTAGARPTRRVSRFGRALDLVGLALFAAGGLVFARAWTGFRSVPGYQPSLDDGPWAAVRVADGFLHLQKVGTALMLAGAAVFVGAWWLAGRASAREGAGR
ncbi:MAG TPA: hypothetical protein VFQ22_01625 [Longimicrobiales bacterium]|nr:hypothetical protein [Longimicrobiales bacterium]